ncbi:hypothetical protein HJ581_0045685 [Rhodococcus opacus]|nr:hypothetical protein HJ581_0045685 [Rhodococcus opacus]
MDDIAADLDAAAWSASPLDDDTYLGEPVPVDESLDAIPEPVFEDDPFVEVADGTGTVDLSVIDLSALDPELAGPPRHSPRRRTRPNRRSTRTPHRIPRSTVRAGTGCTGTRWNGR